MSMKQMVIPIMSIVRVLKQYRLDINNNKEMILFSDAI